MEGLDVLAIAFGTAIGVGLLTWFAYRVLPRRPMGDGDEADLVGASDYDDDDDDGWGDGSDD